MTDDSRLHFLGFAGSLRKGSFNRALLRAAGELLPEGVDLEPFDISPIPLYNGDVEAQGFPEPVRVFREKIRAADAILIVTPEYNYSIPGVLKNAFDWASRPPERPFNDKPVAVMGASPGGFGSILAQHQLRQTFVFTNMHPVMNPQVYVSKANEKFDSEGRLTDEDTRKKVAALLQALKEWTLRLRT